MESFTHPIFALQRPLVWLGAHSAPMAALGLSDWRMWHFWVLGAFLVIILEMLTSGFVLACLAVGCFGGALVDLLGAHGLQPQIWACAVITFASLFLVRPLVMRTMQRSDDTSNTDYLVGQIAIVAEINHADGIAQAKVHGEMWRLQGQGPGTLQVGQEVRVVGVSGNRLLVEPFTSAAPAAQN